MRSTLPVNRERGLRIVSMASRHADRIAEPTERVRLRRDILKSMLAAGDTTLWEEALVLSVRAEAPRRGQDLPFAPYGDDYLG